MSPKRPVTLPPMGPARFQIQQDPKEIASGLSPSPHQSKATYLDPQLNRSLKVSRRLESMVQRPPSKLLRHEDPLRPTTPALVIVGRNDSCASRIQSCCQIIPTFKMPQCSSMRDVMDSGRYLYMTIHVIKRLSSCGYEKIVTCSYGDPMYPHSQRQPLQV